MEAGNGKKTPGKRRRNWSNNTQLFEWKFNRDIVDSIIGYLQVANISYVKLIEESQDISLKERVDRINTIYKENKDKYKVYLISIHGNAADNAPTANGIEVFTSIGETKSDTIAEVFYSKVKNLGWKMRPKRSNKGGKEVDFYLLVN